MNIFFSIIFSLLLSCFVIKDYYKDKKKLKKNRRLKKKKYILFFIIIFIGCFLRSYRFDKYPFGFNYDEASIGYEAYSVLNYGIDRNGMSYPVHFISWGSGQNILYAYLLIPFIKLFGLSIFTVRLPMVIISCFSIITAYYLFKDLFEKYNLIALTIFIIIPWNIMKSRWGLESNIFPDILLLSFYLYNKFLNTNNKKYLYINSILLGISFYSYGTSYVFIPIYMLLILSYLVHEKYINIKDLIINLLITFIIGIPIYLFCIVNYFDLNKIVIFNITIPKLYFNRFEDVTIIKNNGFISKSFNNFIGNLLIIFNGHNDNLLDSISGIGVYYYLSIPFIFIGFYYLIKHFKDNKLYYILFSGLITSLIITIFVTPSIHRINCIWFYMIIVIIMGIICIIKYNNSFKFIIIIFYIILTVRFILVYTNEYSRIAYKHTNESYIDCLKYVNKYKYKKLIVSNEVNLGYIYYLFVNKVDPNYYLKNREVKDLKEEFQIINRIGNVYFDSIYELDNKSDYILSINSIKRIKLDNNIYYTKCFKYYCVLHNKNND